ncbi:hypothetical protein MIR68_000530 [Amoeboaphelidium protococcarum]|nr:hypothetical protein MIR68_000530 [Amoeboaphelidium protococcarum]
MAFLNLFRLSVLAVSVAVSWFAFFSDNGLKLGRRAVLSNVPSFCSTPSQVALTFDEGPSQYTPAVLQGLAANDLKATFHIITDYFSNVAMVTNMQTAYSQGHVIGLRFKPDATKLSCDAILSQLLTMSNQVYQIINVYPKFVRFSYDQYNDANVACVSGAGFVVSSNNIDVMDYDSGVTNEQISSAYIAQFSQVGRGLGRYIGLHHDLYTIYQDPSVLANLATTLKNWGYNSVTMDKCLGIASAYRTSNAAPPGSGAKVTAGPPGSPITPASTTNAASPMALTGAASFAWVLILAFLLN